MVVLCVRRSSLTRMRFTLVSTFFELSHTRFSFIPLLMCVPGSLVPVSLAFCCNLLNVCPAYVGSKITHFKQLHKKTKIPYSEMVRPTLCRSPMCFLLVQFI